MRRKYKMTGCARFFIFLLIFTPLVLVGVSLYNGDNPIEKVKELLGIEATAQSSDQSTASFPDSDSASEGVSSENILKGTIKSQKTAIEELQKKVNDLEKTVSERDKEILYLKQQLGNE